MTLEPTLSVGVVVRRPDRRRLSTALDSVRFQSVRTCELCVVEVGTTTDSTTDLLDRVARLDRRVRRRRLDTDPGAAGAANVALELATGVWFALLGQHDEIEDDTVEALLAAVGPTTDVAYTDEDARRPDGSSTRPFLKPSWSPQRLRSQDYLGQLTMVRRQLAVDLGGYRDGFGEATTYDFALRATEAARHVGRVTGVRYHRWAPDREAPPGDGADHRRAVAEHLERSGLAGTVEACSTPGRHRTRLVRTDRPRVSAVIPTAGTSRPIWGVDRPLVYRCVDTLRTVTDYADLEIVVVVDPHTPAEVRETLAGSDLDLRVVDASGPFNYSARCNLGVERSSGDLIVLLNDDMAVEQPDWLDRMVGFTSEPDVGAVGARLLFADGTIQHAGVVCNDDARHIFHGFPADDPGPFGLLEVDREVFAVTGACLLTPRSVFDQLGGLPLHFPVAFNDLEYCLQLHRHGYRVVWTPQATLHHFESQTRRPWDQPEEIDELYARWGDELRDDPYSNPGFARHQALWLTVEEGRQLAKASLFKARVRSVRHKVRTATRELRTR